MAYYAAGKWFYVSVFMLTVVFLSACTGSGYNNASPYASAPIENAPRQAEKAPSNLILSEEEKQELYSPLTPELQSPGPNGGMDQGSRDEDPQSAMLTHAGFETVYGRQQNTPSARREEPPRYGDRSGGGYNQSRFNRDLPRQQDRPQTDPGLPPVKVALLLPLSGEKEALGKAMLNAAQLALFDVGAENFELVPRDTKGTPAGARMAAQNAVNEGAELILGPLFAGSVRAAKPIAQSRNVNMIAFSTDWELRDYNTYVMGILPFAQVQRIADYAARQGIQRIGVFAPKSAYGEVVVDAFRRAARQNGMEIVETVMFNPLQQSNLSPLVREFTGYDQRVSKLEERKVMLESRLRENPDDVQAQQELKKLKNAQSLGALPFDAVFMPVGGETARAVGTLLTSYDMTPERVRRLGTGLLDDPGLATDPQLQGAVFAAPSPSLRERFETRFIEMYGLRPPRLASLAYDATALAAVLARTGQVRSGMPSFSQAAFTNPNGFAGIDGIFRFSRDGLVERGLSVLEYRDSQIVEVEPAPETFEKGI